jgi:hypothetical protein
MIHRHVFENLLDSETGLPVVVEEVEVDNPVSIKTLALNIEAARAAGCAYAANLARMWNNE